jgi:small subunit ribosomal protein S18
MRRSETKETKFKKPASRGIRRKKSDPLIGGLSASVDYKNTELLSKFLTEKGKIIPRRISGCSAKNQRSLARSIRRARHVGLVPFEAE